MNKTIDLILHRRSVRSYKPMPVPAGVLNAILHAGCAAPHGGPEEPWKFLVIRKTKTKRRLIEALPPLYKKDFFCTHFTDAPVVVAVAFKPTSMGGVDERTELGIGIASAACAIENILLSAVALGLGACWVGPWPEAQDKFQSILGIKAPWELLAFVAIGYPNENPKRRRIKPLGKMVKFIDAPSSNLVRFKKR